MKFWTSKWVYALTAAFCLLTRLPQLLSPNLFLDGDECLIALMTRAVIEGKDFSLYCWGQRYGLSIFQILVIIPFYLLLGYTTVAVKLAMLSIWTTGVIFLYKILLHVSGKNYVGSFLLILLFIASPAWMVMSMNAYAGYVTAFTFSNMLLYMLLVRSDDTGTGYYMTLGILSVLVFESQRLWLVGVLPFMVYHFVQKRNVKAVVVFISTMAVVYIGLFFYKEAFTAQVYKQPLSVPRGNEWLERVFRFNKYLQSSLKGRYYFAEYQESGIFSRAVAKIYFLGFYLVFMIALARLFVEKSVFGIAAALFAPLCFLYSLFSYREEGRYLLPVTAYVLIAVTILLPGLVKKRMTQVFLCIAIVCGIVSAASFKDYFEVTPSHKSETLALINYCGKNNIRYLYSTDCMLPYQLIFYSNLNIMARMPYDPARYQPYSHAVDVAYKAGKKSGIVGYTSQYWGMGLKPDTYFGGIFIQKDPPIYELWKGIMFSN